MPNRLGKWILILPIIAITILAKFAIPLGNENQVSLPILIIFITAFVGFFAQRLEFHKVRLALYLGMIGVLLVTQLLGGYNFSVLSILLFLVVHTPYVFSLKVDLVEKYYEQKFYIKIMCILAVLGIAQYFLQFVIGAVVQWCNVVFAGLL